MIEIHYKQENSPVPNQPWLPSVHGVVLNESGEVLLHQREDHPLWALPGGKLELGESLVDCLKREMREETGLEVGAEKLVGVFSSPEYLLSLEDAVFQPLLAVFLCRVSGGELMLNDESVSFAWMSQKDEEKYETFPLVKDIAHWVWDKKEQAFFDRLSKRV